MTTPDATPDKNLVNIELGQGVDERNRPELAGGIVTLDNLVQDQTGAWVKRAGHVAGPISDGTGTGAQPTYPKKVLSLVTGWAVIGDGGVLLHKQDGVDKYRARQSVMSFNVTSSAFAGSVGPRALAATGGAVVTAASTTTHDAFVSLGAPDIATSELHKLTILERSTGTEYVYDLSKVSLSGTAGAGRSAHMVAVGDRYFHLFVANNPGSSATDVTVLVVDTHAAMPVTDIALGVLGTLVVNKVGGGLVIWDVVGGSDRSYILVFNGTATTTLYTQAAATGANIDSATQAYDSMDYNGTNNTLWLLASSATDAHLKVVNGTASGSTLTADWASGKPGTWVTCNTGTGGAGVFYQESARTFGGGTINSFTAHTVAAASSAAVVVGAAYGWTAVSKPIFVTNALKYYIHLCKQDSTNQNSSHVICDLSSFKGYNSNTAGLALPFGSFRMACQLEPFAAVQTTFLAAKGLTNPYRPRSSDGYDFGAAVTYRTAQRTASIALSRLRLHDSTAFGKANFSGSTYLAHGGLNAYDGRNLQDQGFADQPTVDLVTPGATVGLLAGSYRYVVVYRHVDSNGASTYSRTYGPVSAVNVAASTGKNTLTIQPHAVTNRDEANGTSAPFVEVYRTLNAGTQYYLCASSASASVSPTQQVVANATSGLLTFTDNLADSSLSSQAVMYRQPGTTNAAADRYAAPACKIVVQHKDRLFCVDPYGQRVYYSSFFVDGECAWFNPTFNFFVHAGTGPITALASMDGRLFVFKRDAVFVVDGDGPGEAGPTGNEFSPPQSLASRYGCVDHRSMVSTPDGIIYRSTRGIEILTRSLKVQWIGDKVQNTVNTYPVTTGTCMGPDARVYMSLAASETTAGVPNIAGATVVYDTSASAWSVHKFTGVSYGHYPAAMQSVGVVNDSGEEKVVFADGFSGVRIADDTTGMDLTSTYVGPVIETGWIKQGPQARQRISGILLLAKKASAANHAIRISLAYDYVDTYTQSLVWEPSVINTLAIEELLLKPAQQLVLAIKVKIEEIAPSDTGTYPVGTGRGTDFLSITAEATIIHNAPFANRGVVGALVYAPVVAGISPSSGGSGGGTAVTVYGSNFTPTTIIKVGGTSLSSLVYVSSTVMTGVTPPGTIGAADVLAVNSGGVGTLSATFTYTSAAFDPASLAATMWLRNYSVIPWASEASAGSSGFMPSWTDANSGVAPSAVTLNGHGVAGFNGTSCYIDSLASAPVLYSPSAGGLFCLFYANSASAYMGGNADPMISGYYSGTDPRIMFSTSGVAGSVYSSGIHENILPCSTGSWHLVMMRWDGVNMGVTLDSGAETTVVAGDVLLNGPTGGIMGIGYGGPFLDAKVAEVMTFRSTPSPTDFANFKAYCNSRYALSL